MALSHPKSEYWKTYARWGREFGSKGIISFHILGRRIVVINSRAMAEELLDHRGAIYSDRPFPTMSGLLMKREKSIFIMSYTERLKSYRKLMHNNFNARASQKLWPLQEHEARVFLRSLLQSPHNLTEHIRRYAGAVILKVAYGYEVKSEHDYFLELAQATMKIGSAASAPGKWLVDSWPVLRFLPSWFPGASFKRKAAQWAHQMYIQSLEPHEYVKRELASGKANPSFTSQYLCPEDGPPATAELEDLVLWTAGALYSGGSDTTVSAVRTFFFAMMLHPEVQRLAQAEIDAVVGSHRLPKLSDRKYLPYIEALIKEVLRWGTVSPMALPHSAAVDDEIFGYKIPEGCVVIPNIWAMLHDEIVYPDPFRFDPTRFLGPQQQPDPREIAFGRGRRVCPGQHIAEASVFIQVASVLAIFDIRREVNDVAQELEHSVEFTTGIVSHVKPFKCQVIPRRKGVGALLEQAMEYDS
ncbi:cytochrome P450 [Ramaria rubella]|nr:cytochrome P450 [Ramaria rubella]